jgi:STE24 endopeptidase
VVAAEPSEPVRPRGRSLALGLALVAFAAAWLYAASRLWDTTVPGHLNTPDLDPRRVFDPHDLKRAESFEAFLRVTFLLSQAALIGALVYYARRGPAFVKESAAGRIGTGFLLGMLGFCVVWIAQLPFGLLDLYWARDHHVVKTGYVEYVFATFFGLGGQFVFICVALLIVMAFAGLTRRHWWAPAALTFVALAAFFAFVAPWITTGLKTPRSPEIRADARRLAREEGVADTKVKILEVHKETSQPNAFAFGMGPSRTVVLYDTIADFPRREVDAVMAHEFGHLARHHIPKSIGWSALLLIPTALIVALVTRRRGGLYEPASVPLALLVFMLLGLLSTPLQAAATRRYEAEADWRSLETTHDPAGMRALHRRFVSRALADPDPPGWWHALFEDHPTGLQRIEMADAWTQLHRR